MRAPYSALKSDIMNWLNKLLNRSGYQLTPYPGRSEWIDIHLHKLFKLLEINCVLDVGANEGQYGLQLREMGYTGKIVSFEPSAEPYKKLAATAAADPHWQAHRLALGAEDGQVSMNVTSDSLFNSFLKPNQYMVDQGLRIDHTEEVTVKRLDSIYQKMTESISNPRVHLKMDTQGYDLQVVAGGTQSLQKTVSLQSEVSVQPIYDEMPGYLEAITTLSQHGFEITGLYPIARDAALRVAEFDCVMVRSAAVGVFTSLHPP